MEHPLRGEYATEAVDNSGLTLGATLAPSYETPSQKLGSTLTPNDSWVPERHDLGATLAQAEGTALIGTRADYPSDM